MTDNISSTEGRLAEHVFSRNIATVLAIGLGTLFGVLNVYFPLVAFMLDLKLALWVTLAIPAVIILHEGVHGMMAQFLGHKPIYGIKLPFVYITFDRKIPREHFIAVAMAPLIILNVLFGIVFYLGYLKVFIYICFMINTIGAIGDLWMTYKLLPYSRGVLVQDTKTGFEVWQERE